MVYHSLAEMVAAKRKGGTSIQRPGTRGPTPNPEYVRRNGGGFGNTTPMNGGRPV